MAYVRPIIRIRENHRAITRGCQYDSEMGRYVLQATDEETLKVTLDFSDILDGATITVATSANGLTASSSVAAGVVTLTLSAVAAAGDLDVTTTFSDGRIMQTFLRVTDPSAWSRDDYGLVAVST